MTGQARVIVIGGGIVGCSILYHLARAGCSDALLLERNELTSGATWHAAGNVHTQSAFRNLSALQAYSLRLYDGLAEEVGQEVGSHVVGGFFLARSAERMTEFRFLSGKFRAINIDYELVTPAEVKEKHPLINTAGIVGAAWDPEEGYVDPYSVTMGLAAGARQNGAGIKRNCRVVRIEPRAHGWRIHTIDDEVFDCEVVVNAAGFWADDVARMVGTRLPVTNMEHHYMVTDSIADVESLSDELPMIRDMDYDFYMRQEANGLLAGPWEADCRAAWDNRRPPWDFGQELFANDYDRLETCIEKICECVPVFANAGLKRTVNGAISFAPDARPMIGPMPGVPGFFVACGFLGGIAQGGGIGLAMSQWILEGETELELSFIDVARFGDWTTRSFARARTYEVYPRRYEIIYPHLERHSGRPLRTTPIYQSLQQHGAVMGQAYGWERPLWYAPEGIEAADEPGFARPNWWRHVGTECRAVAKAVGLIEMSSYGKFMVEGPDAGAFLDHVGSARVRDTDGKMALSLLLNERGGIVGDMAVCRLAADCYYVIGATLGEGIYRRWFDQHSRGFDVSVRVVTADYAAMGITGPRSRALLQSLSDDDFSSGAFPFMTSKEVEIGLTRCRALRLSYAGELGWELHCPMAGQLPLFETLMDAGGNFGLTLIGSRALGCLRLEKGYRSWGAEMTTEVSPRSAGLEQFCSSKKHYIGSAAVDAARNASPEFCLATLEVETDDVDCWGSEPIFQAGKLIGYVTSGGYGWRTNTSLAVGWIDSNADAPGTPMEVEILGERYSATVVADPLYDPENSKLLS